jgi:vitamin-K-epoxide reductase (warfarin-sensitive)
MKNRVSTFLNVLFALCGIGLSVASLRSHYATSATEYCDLNEVFNCDIVNRSKFSEVAGIPVALIGLIGYLVLLGLMTRKERKLKILRFCMALVGFMFALYLAYIEEHVLRTWCLLCIGSLMAIAGITIVSAVELWGTRRKPAA